MNSKLPEWISGDQRRYVLDPDDVSELERESGVNEFVNGHSRSEAEGFAYDNYKRKHHVQAAAHHLQMMRAAASAGGHSEAKKHKLVYDLHLKALGHNPDDGKVPDEVQGAVMDPERKPATKFKAHKADAFLLGKSEDGNFEVLKKKEPEQSASSEDEWPNPPPVYKWDVRFDQPMTKGSFDANASPLDVNFLTNKMRQLRDWFDSEGIKNIKEEELPLGIRDALKRVGREPGGGFSRDRIQQFLEQQKPVRYNYTTGTYDRTPATVQRHSDELSNVLRLGITDEQRKKMEEMGLVDAFDNMYQVSSQSGHPVVPGTAGWVRWTGDKSGVHLDEIQSDYGRPWSALIGEQIGHAVKSGQMSQSQAQAHLERLNALLPDEKRKAIQKVLFGNRHPSEVLHEAFHQWARGPGGLAGAPVHVWQPEAKAPIAGLDPTRPIPGHMHVTYRDVPVKMGFEEGKYGQIPTQTGPYKRVKRVAGKVGDEEMLWKPSTKTYKDKIRKSDMQDQVERLSAIVKALVTKAVLEKAEKIPQTFDPDEDGRCRNCESWKEEHTGSKQQCPGQTKKSDKPYMGRDEGIRRSKLPPGAPGSDKAGVGVTEDKKKKASKEAARKWKPGKDE